jgi:hypothetical protein
MDHANWFESLAGHPTLVEGDGLEVTGTVGKVESDVVIVSCDQECWSTGDARQVTISVFSPDALFRLSGKATSLGMTVECEPGIAIERIQRRRWPRRRMDLAVTLCPVEDGSRVGGVPGRTVDVSVGGLCVETLRPVEGEGDPMVILKLPDGTTIVAGASTVDVEEFGDGWRYRLAFSDLDEDDVGRLAALTGV